MKFTIARNTFIKKLNAVQRAISSKTTIPILTGLKIKAEAGETQILLWSTCGKLFELSTLIHNLRF